MKGRFSFLLGVCLVSLPAGAAYADCGFDAPARASGLKTSLIRAHAPCNGGYTFPSPNTVTSSSVAACAAPVPITDVDAGYCAPLECSTLASTYTFADDGRCKVTIKQYSTEKCGNGPEAPPTCLSIIARVTCQGIRDDEDKPAHSQDFSLQTLLRLTTADASPMTVVDMPGANTVHVAGGKIGGDIELWNDYGVPLSPCTQTQILRIELLDDAGLVFATMGSSTRY